jgi:hypothetical protein
MHSEFFEGAMNISHPFTPPTHQWHVEGLLRAGTFNLLAADPKAGKSHLVRQLAAATAMGGKFLGRETRKGKAFLFALEETQAQVREHLTQLGASENVVVVPVGYAIPEDGTARLARMLDADREINLIIFDPIFKFVHVDDTDKYQPVNKALSPLASIAAQRNVTMLATHHANKSYFNSGGGSILGSQAIRANTSANFILQRHYATDNRSLYAEGRGVNFPDTEIVEGTNGFSLLGDSLSIAKAKKSLDKKLTKYNQRAEQAISAVTGSPLTISEIAAAMGVSVPTAQGLISSLRKKGQLVRTGTGSKISPYRYAATNGPKLVTGRKQSVSASFEDDAAQMGAF